jgi:hypothetical protein
VRENQSDGISQWNPTAINAHQICSFMNVLDDRAASGPRLAFILYFPRDCQVENAFLKKRKIYYQKQKDTQSPRSKSVFRGKQL